MQNIGFPMEEGHLEVLCIKNAFYQIFSCLKNHDRKGCISKYVLLIFAPNTYYWKDAKKTSSEFFRQKFEFCDSVHKLASIEQKEMDEH